MATEQVFQWIQSDLHLSKVTSPFLLIIQGCEQRWNRLQQWLHVRRDSRALRSDPRPNPSHQKVTVSKLTLFRTNKEAKVNNFYKIEEALRQLKVKFDAKLIHNIM